MLNNHEINIIELLLNNEINNLNSVLDRVNNKQYWLIRISELQIIKDKLINYKDLESSDL
jgi:hypothetical protein